MSAPAGLVTTPSRRRDCHSVDAPSPLLLKHLLTAKGGAAECQSRRRLTAPACGGQSPPSTCTNTCQRAAAVGTIHRDCSCKPWLTRKRLDFPQPFGPVTCGHNRASQH